MQIWLPATDEGARDELGLLELVRARRRKTNEVQLAFHPASRAASQKLIAAPLAAGSISKFHLMVNKADY